MIYLNKTIEKFILIDIFTEDERKSSDNQVTQKLESFLNQHNYPVYSFFPNSEHEVIEVLRDISEQDINGLIIHFIGHGDSDREIFGNSKFLVKWVDIKPLLVDINTRSNNGLIINTTIMCFGNNVFQLIDGKSSPFYAAIASTTTNSLQAWAHNKEIYKKCFVKDRAQYWLEAINNNLSESSGEQNRYELKFVENNNFEA